MLTVVDYGCGNLASIRNMIHKLGGRAQITADPDEIRHAERIVFPGVGAFDHGAERIATLGIAEALKERVRGDGVPFLGICVGMQLLARSSEEGKLPGLGWIAGDVVGFDRARLGEADKVPHMGWSDLEVRNPVAILDGFHERPRFYFVHSFHMRCDQVEDVAAVARHGYKFCAVVARENIFGVQFHPEKSHRFGMTLLRNFLEIRT